MIKKVLKTLRLNESTISAVLGGLVVVVVGVLIYNYFSGVNKLSDEVEVITDDVQLIEEEGRLVPQGLPKIHVVSKGEHLWVIAERYYGTGYNWVDIAKANNLTNPEMIIEGMELTIPKTAIITLDNPTGEVVDAKINDKVSLDSEYKVIAGDTLWKISVRTYSDGYQWTKIWEANRDTLPNPNLIEIDTVIRLPR